MDLALRATVELQPDGSDVRARWTMRAGDVGGAILESGADREAAAPIDAERVLSRFNETVRFWRGWLGRSTYTGRWREAISRSAMTLKLMTYAPTGALVAAPTTSLPEQVGGERNWDYRFTWVRDASFSVYALLGLGYTDEALAFLRWLRDRVGERAGQASGPLKIMYRIDGSSDLHEETLDHFEDIGDRRLCTLGTVLRISCSSTSTARRWTPCTARVGKGDARSRGMAGRLHDDGLAGRALGRARGGIWEARRAQELHLRPSDVLGRDGPVDPDGSGARSPRRRGTVDEERDRIYRQIMDRGWNKERGAFVQHYDSSVLDVESAHAAHGLCLPETRCGYPRSMR